MDKCPNCGSYDSEQEGDSRSGFMTITCTKCGDRRFLEAIATKARTSGATAKKTAMAMGTDPMTAIRKQTAMDMPFATITRSRDAGDIGKAAMSIAHLVDEWTQRGWNEHGLQQFASIVERRLWRFWAAQSLAPPPDDPQPSELCRRAGGCVCGGDLARVRAGCSWWSG